VGDGQQNRLTPTRQTVVIGSQQQQQQQQQTVPHAER